MKSNRVRAVELHLTWFFLSLSLRSSEEVPLKKRARQQVAESSGDNASTSLPPSQSHQAHPSHFTVATGSSPVPE